MSVPSTAANATTAAPNTEDCDENCYKQELAYPGGKTVSLDKNYEVPEFVALDANSQLTETKLAGFREAARGILEQGPPFDDGGGTGAGAGAGAGSMSSNSGGHGSLHARPHLRGDASSGDHGGATGSSDHRDPSVPSSDLGYSSKEITTTGSGGLPPAGGAMAELPR